MWGVAHRMRGDTETKVPVRVIEQGVRAIMPQPCRAMLSWSGRSRK